MKRLLCLLLCLGLLCCAAAFAEELDEETLASQLQATANLNPNATPEPPELVYAVSGVADGDESIIEETDRPAFVEKLLNTARAELGYVEGDNNYSKYGEWAGDANAAWCAEFVCWCINQTDLQEGTQLLNVVYPNYSGQNTGRDWFIQRGRFVYRKGNCPGWGYQWLRGADKNLRINDFIPRGGDLMFFSYNEAGDTEHVALVEYCATDSNGDVVVHVIEGNNPDRVQRNSYYLNDSQVLGFGVCEDIIGTTMRYGNHGDKVDWLQHALNQLGLLEERHLTGVYGGNTKAAVALFQQEHMPGKNANGIADRETQQAIELELELQIIQNPDSWLVED